MTIIDDIISDLQASDDSKRKFVQVIRTVTNFLENEEKQAANIQSQNQINIATQWFDTDIKPNIKWRPTQSLTTQKTNILLDFNYLKSLLGTEADQHRKYILGQKLEQAEQKFKDIKVAIKQGG